MWVCTRTDFFGNCIKYKAYRSPEDLLIGAIALAVIGLIGVLVRPERAKVKCKYYC